MRKNGLALLAGTLLTSLVTLVAHHAAVRYEDSPTALSGVLREVHWTNPHITVVIDADGARGHVDRWEVEGNGIGQTVASGLSKDMLRVGRRVDVVVKRAKARERREAFLVSLTLNGRTYVRYPGVGVE